MAPAWVDRLRPASFVSPSGVESFFKLDVLSRVGGKKASMHEILNTDEGIPQDQGNRAEEYSIEAYFTDGDGDQESDIFYASLREKYTQSTPGILRHPRWGDIPVMPFEFQQSENIVSEGGIFRVPVTFRKIPTTNFPTPGEVDQSEIIQDITTLEESIEAANAGIDVDDAGLYAEFGATVKKIVKIIGDSLSAIAETVDSINDTFDQIQADINAALAAGDSAIEVLSQVNNLIRTPGQIVDSTLGKLQAYQTMADGIYNSFVGFFSPTADREEELNDAVTLQSIFSLVSASISEAALFTNYETRDQAADALDFVNNSEDDYFTAIADAVTNLSGAVTDTFAPDHDVALNLLLITGKVNAILIDRSFDLKARQTFVLSAPSDPMTLTWKYYESTDTEDLEFFIRTNMLTDAEMVEIPAGTEIVYYG